MFPEVDKYDFHLTVSEALDWIREEKGIECSVNLVFTKCYEGVKILNGEFSSGLLLEVLTDQFDTHPRAESALLTAILEYLIEKKNERRKTVLA